MSFAVENIFSLSELQWNSRKHQMKICFLWFGMFLHNCWQKTKNIRHLLLTQKPDKFLLTNRFISEKGSSNKNQTSVFSQIILLVKKKTPFSNCYKLKQQDRSNATCLLLSDGNMAAGRIGCMCEYTRLGRGLALVVELGGLQHREDREVLKWQRGQIIWHVQQLVFQRRCWVSF